VSDSKSAGDDWFVVKNSTIQGKGAFAVRAIPAGTRIVRYVGQRITPEQASKRYVDDGPGPHHTFLFTLDADTVIDAGVRGNDARFINHSCEPNCEAVIEDGRIYIDAIKDIPKGAELTYDYRLELDGPYRKAFDALYPCRCGAPTCRGSSRWWISRPSTRLPCPADSSGR
jgi:uncharacterized protein